MDGSPAIEERPRTGGGARTIVTLVGACPAVRR
jgi:hypothetical protein